MWLLLLDRSGSMGDPFNLQPDAAIDFKGRTRRSVATSKLEAARRAVAEHLAGLGSATRVVILAFDVTPEVIYEGRSDDADAIAAALAALVPSGGTDVAAALLHAAELVRASSERSARALLVTDGKSELEAARDAAQVLADAGVSIDAVLIDPTTEGEALTRAVAVKGGRVDAVASDAQLREGISRAREAQEAQQADVEAFDVHLAEQRARLATERPVEERLAFTATFPTAVQPQRWYPFTVFMHLTELQDDVARQVREQVQAGMAEPFLSNSVASRGVARGTLLTFTPLVHGLEFNPPVATVAWYEDIQDLRLRFRAPAQMLGRSAYGRLEVSVDSLPIAHLGVAINVQAEPATGGPATQPEVLGIKIYQDVFASYSSLDRSVVLACRAAYWALGIHMIVDKHELRSGQAWAPGVRALIDRSDLFQLFWSGNSAGSGPVTEEYLHALECLPSKGDGFVRPAVWEQVPPPLPEALQRYHFAPLDIAALARAAGVTLEASGAPASAAPTGPLIPAAVVPLLPGTSPDQVAAVRADVSAAVHFLEAVTGLRYYPVPTLLVDDHVVRTVRAQHTVDLGPEDSAWAGEVAALGGFLKMCSLWFHVGGFGPERSSGSDDGRSFGAGSLVTQEQYEQLRRICEVPPDVAPIVAPAWRKAQRRLGSYLGRPSLDLGLRPFFELLLTQIATEVGQLVQPRLDASEDTLGERRSVPSVAEHEFVAAGGEIGHAGRGRGLRLSGPPAAFAALLRSAIPPITTLLSPLDGFDFQRGHPPAVLAADLQDWLGLAGFIARELLPGNSWRDDRHPFGDVGGGFDFSTWMDELIHPRWRSFAQVLAEQGLAAPAAERSMVATVQAMGAVLQPMLALRVSAHPHADLDCGYPLAGEHWKLLESKFGALGLRAVRPSWARADEVTVSGAASGFAEAFRLTVADLVSRLAATPKRRSARQRVFVELTPTFGIFAPAASTATDASLSRWAASQGLAQAFSMPGVDRVLFCLHALERQRKALAEAAASTADGADSQRLAARFQQCVLVHEHFHALVAVGLGDSPRPVASLEAAARLNEALAAWMELHLARGDAALTELVQAYIDAGHYPDWPYAGAAQLEREFADRGPDAIRDWLARLRATPAEAQAAFDRLVST